MRNTKHMNSSKKFGLPMPVACIAIAVAAACGSGAAHAEDVTFLMPAPPTLIAFAPYTIAVSKKYFEKADLNVRFVTAAGGADVAKQLGAGNGDLGQGLGDTAILVRPNGIPVRGVALLGGRSLHQLVVRRDRHIESAAQLKGKVLNVMSYQDTSYYAALAVLAHASLSKSDLDLIAAGPNSTWQSVSLGKADAFVGPPEWGFSVRSSGVDIDMSPTDRYFPGLAQAVIASDDTIARRPDMVRRFVGALVHALDDIKRDPSSAAAEFIAAQPSYKGRESEVAAVIGYYAKTVYSGQAVTGMFDPARVAQLQKFYLDKGIIRSASPVDKLFTNQFVGPTSESTWPPAASSSTASTR